MFYNEAMKRRYMDRPPHLPQIYLTFQLAFLQSPIHSIYTNSESNKDVIYFATDKRFGLADVAQTELPVMKKKNHLSGKKGMERDCPLSHGTLVWPKHSH